MPHIVCGKVRLRGGNPVTEHPNFPPLTEVISRKTVESMSLSSLSSVSVARTARDTPDQETDFEPTLLETTLADTVADTVVQHSLSFVSVEQLPLSKGDDSPQPFPEQVPVVAPTVHEQGPSLRNSSLGNRPG